MSVGISNDIMSDMTLRTVTLSPSSNCFNVSSVKYLPVNKSLNLKRHVEYNMFHKFTSRFITKTVLQMIRSYQMIHYNMK